MVRSVLPMEPSATPLGTSDWSGSLPRNNWRRSATSRNPPLLPGRAVEPVRRRRRLRCSLTSSTSRWSSSSVIARGCSKGQSLAPKHGPLRMQHDDDGTRRGSVSLNRTQRSVRSKGHSAKQHVDEVSGCRRSPQREAHRATFNGEYEVTAESLVGLLPDAVIKDVSVDDVCRQQLFLANLLTSPYVRVN